ncbi:MAG: hypothetical protein HOF01_02760 [Chloroflexi bacterium]|jgi:adenylate kinase family enzyme|nr:hypothetical protein [Chloroflexota bacterium]
MTEIRKIFITGGAGVGKTTLGKQLSDRIDVPFIELDDVMWNLDENGDAASTEVRKVRVSEIVGQQSWIVEGSYVGPAQDLWRDAELVIFMEASVGIVMWRLFLRHLKAELKRNNKHKGWRNLAKFMKVVFKANRDPYIGDIDSNNDEPKLTLARIIAKREQHPEKLLILNASPDINQILALINSK